MDANATYRELIGNNDSLTLTGKPGILPSDQLVLNKEDTLVQNEHFDAVLDSSVSKNGSSGESVGNWRAQR